MGMKHLASLCATVVALCLAMLGTASCESADCTLENHIALRCGFYNKGQKVVLNDTLYVTAAGTDSVLLNRKTRASQFELPMSYWQTCDTFIVSIVSETGQASDTLWVEKTNLPHFESPDCPSYMFHEITGISSTHTFIDSVYLSGPYVDFSKYEHIQIHLHADD